MQFFVGIDVSLENSSICVIDERGVIIKEGQVASEPEAIGRFIRHKGRKIKHVGLETGALSQWLHAALAGQGFQVSVMEARHVRAAFAAMRVKTTAMTPEVLRSSSGSDGSRKSMSKPPAHRRRALSLMPSVHSR